LAVVAADAVDPTLAVIFRAPLLIGLKGTLFFSFFFVGGMRVLLYRLVWPMHL
jgi:hypothetical protein